MIPNKEKTVFAKSRRGIDLMVTNFLPYAHVQINAFTDHPAMVIE
jgi:hypothetical protein